jgi:hypothetical protein
MFSFVNIQLITELSYTEDTERSPMGWSSPHLAYFPIFVLGNLANLFTEMLVVIIM